MIHDHGGRHALAGLLVTALIALAPAASRAQSAIAPADADARHAAAVALYEQGSFDEADAAFRAFLADFGPHPAALLGLGNAAYRRGDWPGAVYAYEWGLRLKPGDEALGENLALARSHLVADVFPSAESPAALKMRMALSRVPGRVSLAAALIAWTVGWVFLAARQRGRLEGWTWLGVALVLLALPGFAHAAWQANRLGAQVEGVLQATEVTVRSGPGTAYPVLFELHAGTVVRVGDERAGWQRVGLPSGSEGWVEQKDVAVFGRIATLAEH